MKGPICVPNVVQTLFRIDEHKLGPVMQFVSRLGSPQYAFTLFFPLLLAVHSSVGVRYLWVAIISDWINMVLKWYEEYVCEFILMNL